MIGIKKELKTFQVQASCATCGSILAFKSPAFTDPIRGQGIIGHDHVCHNCGTIEMLDAQYPLIRYE